MSAAFNAALRAFQKARGSAVSCFKLALDVYDAERLKEFHAAHNGDLQLHLADTNNGPDTALVIVGFRNFAEIETFVSGIINAPRK